MLCFACMHFTVGPSVWNPVRFVSRHCVIWFAFGSRLSVSVHFLAVFAPTFVSPHCLIHCHRFELEFEFAFDSFVSACCAFARFSVLALFFFWKLTIFDTCDTFKNVITLWICENSRGLTPVALLPEGRGHSN